MSKITTGFCKASVLATDGVVEISLTPRRQSQAGQRPVFTGFMTEEDLKELSQHAAEALEVLRSVRQARSAAMEAQREMERIFRKKPGSLLSSGGRD